MADYTYPNLIPNYFRSLELPNFGVQVYQFDSGTESRRFKYDTGNYTKILLQYEGRTAVEAATIISFWKLVRGMEKAFTLPTEVNQHPAAYKSGIALLGTTTIWRFEQPISIQTQFTNLYKWDCRLISIFE